MRGNVKYLNPEEENFFKNFLLWDKITFSYLDIDKKPFNLTFLKQTTYRKSGFFKLFEIDYNNNGDEILIVNEKEIHTIQVKYDSIKERINKEIEKKKSEETEEQKLDQREMTFKRNINLLEEKTVENLGCGDCGFYSILQFLTGDEQQNFVETTEIMRRVLFGEIIPFIIWGKALLPDEIFDVTQQINTGMMTFRMFGDVNYKFGTFAEKWENRELMVYILDQDNLALSNSTLKFIYNLFVDDLDTFSDIIKDFSKEIKDFSKEDPIPDPEQFLMRIKNLKKDNSKNFSENEQLYVYKAIYFILQRLAFTQAYINIEFLFSLLLELFGVNSYLILRHGKRTTITTYYRDQEKIKLLTSDDINTDKWTKKLFDDDFSTKIENFEELIIFGYNKKKHFKVVPTMERGLELDIINNRFENLKYKAVF